jgi:hypothetical protein
VIDKAKAVFSLFDVTSPAVAEVTNSANVMHFTCSGGSVVYEKQPLSINNIPQDPETAEMLAKQ